MRDFTRSLFTASLLFFAGIANSADVTGKIEMIEVWANGNIAFSFYPPMGVCNNQVILNASIGSTKNIYAAILAAKHADRSVRVVTNGCGPAEGYGGSYNLPLYVYPL